MSAEPFTDEELEDNDLEYGIVDLMACAESCHDWKQKRDIINEDYIGRFRATIAAKNKRIWQLEKLTTIDADKRASDRRNIDTIAVLQTRSRADRKRIEELMGGTVPGHKLNCSDCGRAMVWSHPSSAWMCPNCVLHRCNNAEDKVRFLEKEMKERTRLWHNANVEVKNQTATIERLRGEIKGRDELLNNVVKMDIDIQIKKTIADFYERQCQALDGKED